jgi:hypothetical protein
MSAVGAAVMPAMPAVAVAGGAVVFPGRAAVVVTAGAIVGITAMMSRMAAGVFLAAVGVRCIVLGGIVPFARIVVTGETISPGHAGGDEQPGDDREEETSVHK